MTIYDRYSGDSAAERSLYIRRAGNGRAGMLSKGKIEIGVMLACIATAEVALACLGDFGDTFTVPVMFYLALLAAVLVWYFFRLRRECDAHIYGMENGEFLLLNTLYEAVQRIAPADVRCIRILPAVRPSNRLVRRLAKRDPQTWLNPLLEDQARPGNAAPAPLPMAVLHAGEEDINWNRLEDIALFRLQDDAFFKLLGKHLAIVPQGENCAPFVYLLQNSACPVVISRRMYALHGAYLNRLFSQSSMDMNRLHIEE